MQACSLIRVYFTRPQVWDDERGRMEARKNERTDRHAIPGLHRGPSAAWRKGPTGTSKVEAKPLCLCSSAAVQDLVVLGQQSQGVILAALFTLSHLQNPEDTKRTCIPLKADL